MIDTYEDYLHAKAKFEFSALDEALLSDKSTIIMACTDYQQVRYEMHEMLRKLDNASVSYTYKLHQNIIETETKRFKFIYKWCDTRGYDRHDTVIVYR